MENGQHTPSELYTAVQDLLETGSAEGQIRASELLSYLEELNLSPERLEQVYLKLEAMNIKLVSDDEVPDPVQEWKQQLSQLLEKYGSCLSEREKRVLLLRFCPDRPEQGMTLAEVAELEGVTRERIRHVESSAVQKLFRRARPRRKIRNFYD